MLIQALAETPDLRLVAAAEARTVMALRLWIVMGKLGHCPLRAITERLGCARAAAHLHLLMEEIGTAWPDPFCAASPCCPRLSHDEALALEMIRAGGRGDRPAFDRLLADMLPADVRERLYLSASVLSQALENA
ncbi:addiction module antidote protein [Sphingosinicella sp. LHD-64]|uniref:addiction module antidote protein n=1 Tax=Sphingosinicella sp. LHD-64 TaxID=3072139 RepID=UPI00280FBC68|nr:addiction module antidote protein [Sphingosinicella sp. LHD-64]MDQ8756092.1 addiction module antidote protein [Sphingosinicella sp. LHD-64]